MPRDAHGANAERPGHGRAQRALDVARARYHQFAWAFHDTTVSARLALKAQFGPDSTEVHAAGMTRTSDRKRPTRRAKPSTT